MKYEFTNDELFVMCAIGGGDSVTGVANPFSAMANEEIKIKIKGISAALEERSVLIRKDDGIQLSEEFTPLVKVMIDPEILYIFVGDDDVNEYVYICGSSSAYMLNRGMEYCKVETFDNDEGLKKFFGTHFNYVRVHKDTIQYYMSISSDIIDRAIEQVKNGNMDAATAILGADNLDREEMQKMLRAVVYPLRTKTIVGYRFTENGIIEAVFKLCDTEAGTWIVKITTSDDCRNTMLYKATVDDMTKILFSF